MKKLLKTLTLLILLTSIASCISVRSNKYSAIKPEELKVSSTKKSKIFIDWGFHSSFFSQTKQNVIDKLKSDQKRILSDVIKDSDCCEIVNEKDEANIFINGAFHNETSDTGMVFAMITGFSLYTIPSWMNVKMRISAKAQNGKISKEYNLDDSMLFAQWLPFIVVPIFAGNQTTVEAEVNKNLYKTLISQMKKDGFFGK